MQCSVCPDHPKLERIQYEENPAEDTPTSCHNCGWKLLSNREYWTCPTCRAMRLCSLCKICPQGHTLGKIKFLNKIANNYHSQSYMCDNCKKSATPGSDGVWHCISCQFDLCDTCGPK